MADGEAGHVLTQKVGPLPLVLWVVGGSAVIFVVMLMRNKGSSGAQALQTNQVTALAPTEAEAFGTIEQQQQDVTNALTTLGNNQSALGGSMSSLTGIVTQQGADNAAAFQNLVDGQNTIQQGQTAASSQATNYYQSVLANMLNYFNSTSSQINGVNSNIGQTSAALAGQLNTINANITTDAQAQAAGFQSLNDYLSKNDARVGTLVDWVDEIKARLQQGDYSAARWGPSGTSYQTALSPKPA